MKVFVVIVTYNGMRWIDWCLQSLRQSTVPVTPVIVDNCSTDGLREYVPEHYPEVIWLPQSANKGFGQGNNIGMRYAMEHQADYVLLLNQDACLEPDAMEHMLAVADGHNMVTPVHLNGDGTRIDHMFRESMKRAGNELLDDLLLAHPRQSYSIGEVCAACWLMPVEMLQRVGGFSPLFFQYGEDNNYYTRMQYHGYHITLAPQARMHHDRKVHGNAALYNRKRVHLLMLIAAMDPNLSLLRRMMRLCLLTVRHLGRSLPELVWLLAHAPSIIRSRAQDKRVYPSWL